MSDVPVLQLHGVSAGYGPFRALFDIDLAVPAGGAVALLGANGAGKTTVARVVTGLVKPIQGTVTVDGVDMTGQRTYKFARAGISHAPEGRSVFSTLTVEENLALPFRRQLGRAKMHEGLDRAFEIFPQLASRRRQIAGTLSGGEQRMLSLARPLVEQPKLLVADELSLGLAPIIVNMVYEMLARVREAGTAVLVVEQHIGHALALCDHAILLEHGSIAWQGPADEAREVVTTHLFESQDES
jgi:branched-chain amino acid transport system ATP-binding protein